MNLLLKDLHFLKKLSNLHLVSKKCTYPSSLVTILKRLFSTPNHFHNIKSFSPTLNILEFINQYSYLTNGDKSLQSTIHKLGGRIIGKRQSSSKLYFYDIMSNSQKLQIVVDFKYIRQNSQIDPNDFELYFHQLNEQLGRGAIIGIEGYPLRTKKGELSLYASNIWILHKAGENLPMMNYMHKSMLTNHEIRFQKRYLDFVVNSENMGYFFQRAKIIQFIRSFLQDKGCLEVETPIMSSKAGGAIANPFITNSDLLNTRFELRIAPELYLKELIAGGFERVFEIGKNFRNEGISPLHNPEFTTCEFYISYENYLFTKNLIQEMFLKMMLEIFDSSKLMMVMKTIENKDPEIIEIDFAQPFHEFNVIEELENYFNTKIDLSSEEKFFSQIINLGRSFANFFKLEEDIEKMNVKEILNKLIENIIETKCLLPSFIQHHPAILSPLAKPMESCSILTERFELFINKMEVVNAYSELTDPKLQKEKFIEQQKFKKVHNDEAQDLDYFNDHFLEVLEFGLPPTTGCGIGIDRLVMLFCGITHIRESILFPMFRASIHSQNK